MLWDLFGRTQNPIEQEKRKEKNVPFVLGLTTMWVLANTQNEWKKDCSRLAMKYEVWFETQGCAPGRRPTVSRTETVGASPELRQERHINTRVGISSTMI